MRLIAFAIGCLLLAACGERTGEDEAQARGGRGDGGLPTPAGTPGSSVTGMPTDAPPQAASDAAAVAIAPTFDPATAPVEGLPPGDAGAIPIDPATGMAATAEPSASARQPSGADISAAGDVVRDYMAALGSGAFAGAQQLWSTTPNDSAVLELARGQAFAVDVLAPAGSPDPAANGVITVPVRVRGATADTPRLLSVTYTVRRTREGAWRIASAAVREESP